ncbi:predicted protein [Lichtheimia corymbifera JMRC:FSU:9682]|uniref:Uncharacterized protein n=1 Tax=Lichtheimia corymbifera JMRC:FSU:9682 TaxID=1263082 RepID=A0A068S8I9_9FUNG|nr:predicted protein [Lichtheimia corymbifera JMRC:FSU:9682]
MDHPRKEADDIQWEDYERRWTQGSIEQGAFKDKERHSLLLPWITLSGQRSEFAIELTHGLHNKVSRYYDPLHTTIHQLQYKARQPPYIKKHHDHL